MKIALAFVGLALLGWGVYLATDLRIAAYVVFATLVGYGALTEARRWREDSERVQARRLRRLRDAPVDWDAPGSTAPASDAQQFESPTAGVPRQTRARRLLRTPWSHQFVFVLIAFFLVIGLITVLSTMP